MRNSISHPALLGSAVGATSSKTPSLRRFSAAPPPPTEPAVHESYLSGTSGAYVEEMYEAWSYDPKSVHASWDAYFRGDSYQAPPSLGASTRPNEVSLASLMPGLSGVAPAAAKVDSHVIDTHLAVQGAIRYDIIETHLVKKALRASNENRKIGIQISYSFLDFRICYPY